MPHLTFSLPDGSIIYLETSSSDAKSGPQPAGRLQDAALSFEAALDNVKKMLGPIVMALRTAVPEQPDECEIAFGLKGALEVNGFLVAKVASEAHYEVKMTWKKTISSV